MKIKSSIVIALLLIFQNNMNSYAMENDKTLNDINGHWAYESITDFYNKGIINGYEDGSFKPNNQMTRAEFVKAFNKVFGLTDKSGKIFEDTKNHWAKDEIDIAVSNGVCKGVSEKNFEPNRPITREEMCVMIANYLNLSDNKHDKLENYIDKPSKWALDSVEAILEKGIMTGYEDKTFKPKTNSTRAEVVTTLNRIDNGISQIDTEKINKIIKSINELGESVVFNSAEELDQLENRVKELQNQCSMLSLDEQKLVTNYNKLEKYDQEIKEIRKQLYIVLDAISYIPEKITKENLYEADKAVALAENEYKKLSDQDKKGIKPWEYSIIERSREKINRLKESIHLENTEKISKIIKSINELGESVVFNSEEELDQLKNKVKELQNQYNMLSLDEQKLVTNYNKLEKYDQEIKEIRKQLYIVLDAISYIPEKITKENLDEADKAVALAENEYKKLSDQDKKGIKPWEYSIIERSREKINRLKESSL